MLMDSLELTDNPGIGVDGTAGIRVVISVVLQGGIFQPGVTKGNHEILQVKGRRICIHRAVKYQVLVVFIYYYALYSVYTGKSMKALIARLFPPASGEPFLKDF